MEINIIGTAKEIADLVSQLQSQQEKTFIPMQGTTRGNFKECDDA